MRGAHYGLQNHHVGDRADQPERNRPCKIHSAERVHHPADDQRLLPDVSRPIPAAKVLLFSQIREAIEEYEPRVRVKSVDFDTQEEMQGVLSPIVEVEIVDES